GIGGFGGGFGGGISGGISGGTLNPNRGMPFALRPQGNGYSLPGPIFFGGFPQPVQTMPIHPSYPAGRSGNFQPSRFWTGVPALNPQDPAAVNEDLGGAPRQPPAGAASEGDTGARRVVIRSGEM